MKYEKGPNLGTDIPEKSYDEDDETMMIVRGVGSIDDTPIETEIIPDETFNLCDYYQVSGNPHRFTVYTLTKKKGKPTGEVSTIVYSYDEKDGVVSFTSDESRNTALLNCNLKLKSVLLFSASMCGIPQDEIFKLNGVNSEDGISTFNLLKILSTVYNLRKTESED